jgi:uncharacterized protein (TIGR00251 family)
MNDETPLVIDLEATDEGVVLPVQAQPKARKNALVGVHDGRLKVAITQAPEKGKANDAIIKLLAKSLNLKRSQIELLTGATSSKKKFLLHNITSNELRRRLAECLEMQN